MYQAQITEVQYQDVNRNSDKFYRCYRLWDDETGDHRVVFQWGRRGAKGQSNVNVTGSERESRLLIARKLDEKLGKGYHHAYANDLPGVPADILHLAGINTDRSVQAASRPQDPFVRIAVDVDTCRRLAMGDQSEVTKAVVMRKSLQEQLEALRTSVSNAEGQVEVVDMILSAKV